MFDIGSIIGAIGSLWQQVAMGKLEREIANAASSALASMLITGLWSEGTSKWAIWSGAGQGLKDSATAAYLSLHELEKKGFLTLTIPSGILKPENLSRFQTEYIAK